MASDRRLFTPGPLTTSPTVKEATLHDLGSRDEGFITVVRRVRAQLLALAGADPAEHAAIPVQGSGTFGVEAVLGSAIPADGKLLVLENGVYGARIAEIARVLGIPAQRLSSPEHLPIEAGAVTAALADPALTHVAIVHSETTTGLVNPLEPIAAAVRARGRSLIIDAMSSFGALPLDVRALGADFMVSSPNKCLQGLPGFAFVIARRSALEARRGQARSLSLDLLAQLEGLDRTGQFRFTPPVQALLALDRALTELADEGGPGARLARYRENHRTLLAGLGRLGFRAFLAPEHQGPIITSFQYPADRRFRFEDFYERLGRRGFVIYPGKLSRADCFRIGTIGHLFPADVVALVDAVASVLGELELPVPLAG
jgi:2-aminoethylphosphonate-pyruvate transaminase